jgi:uncharacterized protein (DUF1501 family)
MKQQFNRRKFLKGAFGTTLGYSPFMAMLGSLSTLEAADVDGEYKAIVCILLEGGADVFNMVVPREDTPYQQYQAVRKHLSLPQSSLLAINHDNISGDNPRLYGLRDNMGRMQQLFEDRKLAIVANVGTLAEPVNRSAIENGSAVLPQQLFAHNTQRSLWMIGDASQSRPTGWAARMGDLFYPTPNPYFNVTVAGNNQMQLGGIADAIAFDDAYVSPDTMRYYGFGPESGGSALGNVYEDIYEARANDSHRLMAAMAQKRVEILQQQETLGGSLFEGVQEFDQFDTGVHEVGKPLGKQLEIVAKILSVKNNFPGQRKRQVFFVNHHGWDTHDSDNAHQAGYLSECLGDFQDAMESMGISQNVTTFTISDFGRSLSPNGAGTDHGWGSYAFVMGGAVKGREIYGKMPRLEPDSPDAWIDRMIPTTPMESYLATIVKWFGATESELDVIFPNRHAFSPLDLGFMS